ncbi:tRNA (guanine-N7)-methyltransferase [Rugosibacter aromaticivorans]|uniref:tRNA (guanine-N(7)-)-methyltransferase n=1 Tax=Rugosibacter aromaticivorans TaxID=1565605 RepID=A0A0C5JK60_9PROT|nr:tRNA (guanosine(46)-N7)-methyltransferase TrmB [Rugosibacter aromaticivorans]AJP47761.1 tRNA (guanine-N7)-methyltransferase [Rugosibacter aromaticivorans]
MNPAPPDLTESTEETPDRHIRSFVLRQGRVSAAQRRFHEEGMPRWGIPYQQTLLDWTTVFGPLRCAAPKILEIGCGMGETTAAIAASQPENDYLGIEVHTPGVGSLLKEIATRGLTNLHVIQHDAVEVVRDMIAPQSLFGIHVFFPDPWPKKRQQKRRLIQPAFVHALAQRLAPNGYIHCATDWQDYAEQMLAVLTAEPLLNNIASDYAPRPSYRPQTKFETRGLRLGHGVWDVIFRRTA